LKQNEPKVQGCEKIDGGHGISATFYQWSITFKAVKKLGAGMIKGPRRSSGSLNPSIFQGRSVL